MALPVTSALVVVDVQQGFDDPVWGRRDNPACDDNIARLVAAVEASGRPVVLVRHDSREPGSPLAPGSEGNRLKPYLDGTAEQLARATATNLHGEFATVTSTDELLAALADV